MSRSRSILHAVRPLFLGVLTYALLPAAALAETRLVLIGGGNHPRQAIARFAEWAGGTRARVLVVNWASGEPKESCDDVLKELAAYSPASAECGPGTALDAQGHAAALEPESARDFRERLARATAVFFTGGDQARVMDVLKDETLLAALRARFAAGVVFGGTSAGTAIMSRIMITGEGDFTVIDGAKVEVRQGLGLIEGAIVDQHFVKRQRENRLFGLVLAHPELRGIGVDEATALLVRGGRHGEVVGAGVVMLVDAQGKDRLRVTLIRPGQEVDLRRR